MKVVVHKSILSGSVKAIASKSHAHRILICAALSDIDTKVICEETSKDIEATVNCLRSMGADITRIENGYLVKPIEEIEDKITIDCNESGSTLRFLLPLVCTLEIDTDIYMKGRLPERPLSPLYEELVEHGAIISEQGIVPLHTRGAIESGEYILPGNVSSQYISGLLFALPLLDGDSIITLTSEVESKSYIDMTIEVLSIFGITIEWKDNVIIIPGNQNYISPSEVIVEGDWSNVAFWLCAGALNNEEITCTNLNFLSSQGDKEIIDILKRMGADIIYTSNSSVIVKRNELIATQIDAANIPDLVPILALMASVAKGRTTIYNAGRLKLKESDRLESVSQTLKNLGADIEKTDEGLIITGVKALKSGSVDSYNDHRIAMMASIAAMVSDKSVIINNAEAIDKSYGNFYADYKKLGGDVSILHEE